ESPHSKSSRNWAVAVMSSQESGDVDVSILDSPPPCPLAATNGRVAKSRREIRHPPDTLDFIKLTSFGPSSNL
ncbi:MAG: hypothetical protein KDA80_05950, partial [Planctomycetaceae bacterium]|nr:hypothetical protein [Planctomycetaceae bacterium]